MILVTSHRDLETRKMAWTVQLEGKVVATFTGDSPEKAMSFASMLAQKASYVEEPDGYRIEAILASRPVPAVLAPQSAQQHLAATPEEFLAARAQLLSFDE